MVRFLKNCPINERTGNGILVGRCWFHTGDGDVCPRHGDVKKYLERLPVLTDENEMLRDRGLPELTANLENR